MSSRCGKILNVIRMRIGVAILVLSIVSLSQAIRQKRQSDGSYNIEYTSDDGSYRKETGVEGNKEGEYGWKSPEGEEVSFTFNADEEGFVAEGSHLPQPVPLPENLKIWAKLMGITE